MNRTTLLLKEGKDPGRAESYRPVTISSVLSRLYWGIIDQRLRSQVRFTPRQKGFVSESGCFNNVHILKELLRQAKGGAGLVAVQLDVSKAFDTIPHVAIGAALRRKGIPELVVRLVEDSYKDVHTVISQGTLRVPCQLQRGVKQGDPLSPFVFNAVLEPLLLQLERQPGFPLREPAGISTLAFADDLILVATEVPEASRLLGETEAYLNGLGMKLSAPKSACFRIIPTKDSWYLADPRLTLRSGEVVPLADGDTKLTYLGARISPWAGLSLEGLREELGATLFRVKRLALKPHQKVTLISTYLVPHYLYRLVLSVPPITLVRQLDQELRVVVKDILHLQQSVADGLIYCCKRDGGLGFPKLEIVLVSASLKTGIRFLQNESDPVIRALAEGSGLENRLKRLAASVRMNWPATERETDQYKKRAKKAELVKWDRLGSQGKSVGSFTDDRIANAWLFNPTLLKPGRYITALKMRINTTANRVVMNRAIPQADLKCRKCRTQLETLGHILGQCIHTKALRISRHDEIRDLVMAQAMRKDALVAVTKEPDIRLPSGNLKPDLVVINREGVFVVDVTVRHEDGELLAMGRRSKLAKYRPLLPDLQQRVGRNAGEILPVVVGTRGALPKETVEALRKLKITDRKTLLTISMIALRSSIEIYHQFMDYDAPQRPDEG